MAKPARGLPEDFHLDLPDEKPVQIGDFLDEEPPAPVVRKPRIVQPAAERAPAPSQFRPEIVRDPGGSRGEGRFSAGSSKRPTTKRHSLSA